VSIVPLEVAQSQLPSLIRGLRPGEEVVITENDQPVARLLPATSPPRFQPRRPGTLRGTVLYMAPDFNAPLDDFKEYME
jgi:antitoxin (DNA-binding transcriptional repressor) of toxin-antitoxin stability system